MTNKKHESIINDNLILKFKGVDEDGTYNEFYERAGDGAIPVKDCRLLITSEPES